MAQAVPGVLGEFAPIIRGMARLGIPATAVWEMELHDLAASLGIGEAPQSTPEGLMAVPGPTGAELAAERTRRAQEGQPALAEHLAAVPADTSVAPVPPEVIEALRKRRAERAG